jgi:hypothetical protein
MGIDHFQISSPSTHDTVKDPSISTTKAERPRVHFNIWLSITWKRMTMRTNSKKCSNGVVSHISARLCFQRKSNIARYDETIDLLFE